MVSTSTVLQAVMETISPSVVSIDVNGSASLYHLGNTGIPQGSPLSSVLCDLYFSDMEKKCISNGLLQKGTELSFQTLYLKTSQ